MNIFISLGLLVLSFASLAVFGFYSIGMGSRVHTTQGGVTASLNTGDLIQVR